jgi:hypothetical protein
MYYADEDVDKGNGNREMDSMSERMALIYLPLLLWECNPLIYVCVNGGYRCE